MVPVVGFYDEEGEELESVRGPAFDLAAGTEGQIELDVDVPSAEPVFGDGPALNLVVGALPLEAGYVTTLHRLDLMRGVTSPLRIEVTGSESVTVPGGTFEAWVVGITAESGDGSTLWIDQESRRVVRAEMQLGPRMGGGTAVLSLTEGL